MPPFGAVVKSGFRSKLKSTVKLGKLTQHGFNLVFHLLVFVIASEALQLHLRVEHDVRSLTPSRTPIVFLQKFEVKIHLATHLGPRLQGTRTHSNVRH